MYGFRWIDTTNPLHWKCELPAHYSVEEFTAEFDRATEVLHAMPPSLRFVYAADIARVESSDPRNRARVARFLSECREPLVKHVVAWGIITPRPLLRGAVTAVMWISSFPVPTRVFAETGECNDWLDQQLALDQLAHETA